MVVRDGSEVVVMVVMVVVELPSAQYQCVVTGRGRLTLA